MLLFIICFIAGILTVLAPCILPVLPIIIGGNLSNGKLNYKKVFTVLISLAISIIVFTLLLKATTLLITVPEFVWKWISGAILIAVGLYSFFPKLWGGKWLNLAKNEGQNLIKTGQTLGSNKKSIRGDIIIGAALGPVFSTCSPTYFIVLASVLPVSLGLGIIYLLSFVAGLLLALLIITILGFRLISYLDLKASSINIMQKIFAALFILVGIFIITGLDKQLQIKLLDAGYFDITKIENKLLKYNDFENKSQVEPIKIIKEKDMQDNKKEVVKVASKINYDVLGQAKELSGISGYINVTEGETLKNILAKNKVVLFEFWTYDCINCRRTLPYLDSWYDKYHEQGLEIVGVHTPEFSHEKIKSNVEKKVREYGIKFPVFMDNEFSTWNSYSNQYWPMRFLMLPSGEIIYMHAGEGDYENNEKLIQQILAQ
jgi:cytochrome c biogenesis protein CcdA/thiol-disulfide isomerase/thioredoxin